MIAARRVLLAAAVTATALVVVGWTTGLRHAMHGALLFLGAVALLPFVVMMALLGALTAVALLFAFAALLGGIEDAPDAGGIGEGVVMAGSGLTRRYYAFLARRREPALLGVALGLLLGASILWGVIATIVVPGETRTAELLAAAKGAIERSYHDTGELPRPDANGHLRLATGSEAAVLVDGFGRPLAYRLSGKWKLASWTLASAGFDGATSADDLCVSGGTKLMQWVDTAAALGSALPSYRDRLSQVRALRCTPR